MAAPIIRFATPADLPAVAALHIEATAEMAPMVPQGFGQTFLETAHDADEAKLMFSGKIAQEDGFLLVAELDTELADGGKHLAGFLVAHIEEYSDDLLSAPFLTIEDVVVARPRALGVGGALILAAEDVARQRGITQIDLLVWAANAPARALYHRLGYGVLEERRGKSLALATDSEP
jgi:ribosomal protein S18 acetylase RimI-like enzyme